jgi:hypothetical protein
MKKFKPKTLEKLKDRLKTHYNLYKDYIHIGKLRAEGKLYHKGRMKTSTDVTTVPFGIEHFEFDFPKGDKSQPHFKGQCQAMGTGDSFKVAAWLNTDGSLRIEIYESEGYRTTRMTNGPLPF